MFERVKCDMKRCSGQDDSEHVNSMDERRITVGGVSGEAHW